MTWTELLVPSVLQPLSGSTTRRGHKELPLPSSCLAHDRWIWWLHCIKWGCGGASLCVLLCCSVHEAGDAPVQNIKQASCITQLVPEQHWETLLRGLRMLLSDSSLIEKNTVELLTVIHLLLTSRCWNIWILCFSDIASFLQGFYGIWQKIRNYSAPKNAVRIEFIIVKLCKCNVSCGLMRTISGGL